MTNQFQFIDQHGNSLVPGPHFGTVAFWVKDNTIVEVETRHIRVIIARPELFGLTTDIVESVHQETGEKHGTEGVARARLIESATEHGWIRVRHYVSRHSDYWSIQLDHRESRVATVRRFIDWAREAGYMHREDEVRITDRYESIWCKIHEITTT
jgi:uncharacterized protein YwbE